MRIALLSFEYPPETGFGGIGTYAWTQARALARLGHEVHVVAGAAAPGPLAHAVHDGVTVWRAKDDGPLVRAVRGLGRFDLWWTRNRIENGLTMGRVVKQLQRELAFDVIEMPECGAEGLFVTRAARAPTVVRFHSPARLIMPFYDVPALDVTLCSAVEQRALGAADAYTSCSRFLADQVRLRLGVSRPVPVIPNGIDLAWFDAADLTDVRGELGLPAGRPVVLFAGRMERRKGVHLLPAIARAVLAARDVALVLAGDDLFGTVAREVEPALRATALKGSLHVLGRLDQTRLRSLVRQADVVLLPSLWEACPYACLEAMAAGRAVVASDAGGLPELVRDGSDGLLAPAGDAEAFAALVVRVLDDASLRVRLGAAARQRVERDHADARVAERSLEVYRACA